jgi:hypothetical protein
VNVVAHRNAAAPHELSERNSALRIGQLETGRLKPDRVADVPDIERKPFDVQRRIVDVAGPSRDAEHSSDTVRVGDASVAEARIQVVEAVDVNEPFVSSAVLAAPLITRRLARERPQRSCDRAVTLVAAKRIGRPPLEQHCNIRIVNVGRVDHDVIAERAIGTFRLCRSRWEDTLIVPFPVRVLLKPHDRPRHVEMTQENAAVEQVAHVVAHAHRAARDEQRVLFITNLDRVDRHAAEEAAADSSDVERPANFSLDPRLNVLPHLVLAVASLRNRYD